MRPQRGDGHRPYGALLQRLEALRRRVRRSLGRDPGWEPAVDRGFPTTVAHCALPRADGGVWLTPRLARLYGKLHAAGVAHSFELWEGRELVAGILGVVLGRAAMLETMFHVVDHAGNVNLVRTLERLDAIGVELCDIQLASDHTRRLGARPHRAARARANAIRSANGRDISVPRDTDHPTCGAGGPCNASSSSRKGRRTSSGASR